MSYFNELPNLEVVSRFPNQSSNQDYTTIKNLWRRAKLREDIANAVTAFNYYQIKEGERPDQIAEKVYGDPELDWVILITNNITNVNDEWPLDNETFYNYLIDKYGSEAAIQNIHHTETVEQKDKFNRLIIPSGLKVDSQLEGPEGFTTAEDITNYKLTSYPALDGNTEVKINLIQGLDVKQNQKGDVLYLITDIQFESSSFKVYQRDGDDIDIDIDINIINDVQNTWPSGWGGNLVVYGRNNNINIDIEDVLSDDYSFAIPNRLYQVIGVNIDGKIVPTFQFIYNPPG